MLFLLQCHCQKDEMRTDQNKIKRLGPFSFLQKSTVSMIYWDTENKTIPRIRLQNLEDKEEKGGK